MLPLIAATIVGCGGSSGVMQKVKYDFGIGEKPEGFVAPSERILERLAAVGETEMKRLNAQNRQGEVKFQPETELTGKYYKEIKVYERALPLEANAVTQSSQGKQGYVGYITYTYRIMQSERKDNRIQAEAASANIPTDVSGQETYRYRFSSGGAWDNREGELTRR